MNRRQQRADPLVRVARDEADWNEARALFREYESVVEDRQCFSGFEQELAEIHLRFGPPHGVLLLVGTAFAAEGCGGLVLAGEGICEMKRLYVKQAARGEGLGRALACSLLQHARRLGYARVQLETLPSMQAAQALYHSLGFRVSPDPLRAAGPGEPLRLEVSLP